MAQGILGSADLPAAIDIMLFTVGATQTFNVRFANRTGTPAKVRVCIGSGDVPALKDWVTPDVTCLGNGIVEDTGLVCSSGEKVWVRADAAGVSVRAHGL